MNSDLISRSELKKAIEQGEGFSWDSLGKDDLCVRKKYIDNAPTVDPYDICKGVIVGNYALGFHLGWEKAKERPQGEWIISQTMNCHSDIIDIYTCPFCGEKEYCAYPFCHCGAGMRKGGKDGVEDADQ